MQQWRVFQQSWDFQLISKDIFAPYHGQYQLCSLQFTSCRINYVLLLPNRYILQPGLVSSLQIAKCWCGRNFSIVLALKIIITPYLKIEDIKSILYLSGMVLPFIYLFSLVFWRFQIPSFYRDLGFLSISRSTLALMDLLPPSIQFFFGLPLLWFCWGI